MNNKAFTLIELVGIILVLAAIFLVSFPSLLNMAKADEEKEYNKMVEDLCLAGQSYIYANMDDFPELSIVDSTINIEIEELVGYGNIDGQLQNPRTKNSVVGDSLVYTVLSDYSLDCIYIDD